MKRLIGLMLAIVVILPATMAFSQQGYLLVVRGGGELHFNYTPFSTFSPDPQVWITFKKGQQGVGQNWQKKINLQPGEAAWLDRRIEPTEPERIIVTGVKEFSISWSPSQIMGISSSLSYLSVLRDANKCQSFYVTNDGQGNFIVTAVGPTS